MNWTIVCAGSCYHHRIRCIRA